LKQDTLNSIFPKFLKSNYLVLLELPIVIILGFLSKLYRGPYHLWLNNSLGGVFYVIFFILLFSLAVPKKRVLFVSLLVLIGTSGLEFLQLWHPPFLEAIRGTFIGVTILGNTFVPSDFIYYFIGGVSGFFLTKALKRS
jgi:hypothetical protein